MLCAHIVQPEHDMLAVVLSRWHDKYSGVSATRALEKRKRNSILAAGALAILLVGCGAALIGRPHARSRTGRGREHTAQEHVHGKGPERQLPAEPATAARQSEGDLGAARSVRQNLRRQHYDPRRDRECAPAVPAGAPWLSGEYAAVGLDPDGAALATLRNTVLTVISLPKHGVVKRRRRSPTRWFLRRAPLTLPAGCGPPGLRRPVSGRRQW